MLHASFTPPADVWTDLQVPDHSPDEASDQLPSPDARNGFPGSSKNMTGADKAVGCFVLGGFDVWTRVRLMYWLNIQACRTKGACTPGSPVDRAERLLLVNISCSSTQTAKTWGCFFSLFLFFGPSTVAALPSVTARIDHSFALSGKQPQTFYIFLMGFLQILQGKPLFFYSKHFALMRKWVVAIVASLSDHITFYILYHL